MSKSWLKFLTVTTCATLLALAGSVPCYATCATGISVSLTKPGGAPIANCGLNAVAQFWIHKKGIWNSATTGIDSGTTYPNTNPSATAGSWFVSGDWGNSGVNGCPQAQGLENGLQGNSCSGNCDISGLQCSVPLAAADCDAGLGDTVCVPSEDLAATDFVIAGKDPANPSGSVVFFGSVDLNECSQAYALDSLGATAGNGSPCPGAGSDCDRVGPSFSCVPVVFPTIIGATSGTNSTTFTLSLPGQTTPIPYRDDCDVASSRSVNCPRDLDAGRVLMFRRGVCGTVPPSDGVLSTAAGVRLWHAFDPTDTDYNGNSGVPGTTPNPISATLGTANCTLPGPCPNRFNGAPHTTQIAVASGTGRCVTNATGVISATTCTSDAGCVTAGTSCDLQKGRCINPLNGQQGPAVCSPTIPCPGTIFTACADCLYLGLAAAGDASPAAGSTQWIAPYISINATNPIDLKLSAPGATPATDRVVNLAAVKTGGKASLSWDTTAELSTSGFKVMGQRKTGAQFPIGPSLIEATGKTDGQSYHYSVDLSGGDLKGATKIFIVVVHPSGPDETFGPANL